MEEIKNVLLALYFDKDRAERLELVSLETKASANDLICDARLYYVKGEQKIQLCREPINSILLALKGILIRTINNEKQLDQSIVASLGYMQSQDYEKRPRKNFVYETLLVENNETYTRWVGRRYELYCAHGLYIPASWLYNDKEGNIILEITPIYQTQYSDQEPVDKFIKYSEWMKNYKTLVKTKIPKKEAQQWIPIIDDFLKQMEMQYYKNEGGGCVGCEHCPKEGKEYCHCGVWKMKRMKGMMP